MQQKIINKPPKIIDMTTNLSTSRPLFTHLSDGLIEILGNEDASSFSKSLQSNELTDNLETRGILIRAGRAGFNYWLKQNDSILGWDSSEFRLFPVKKKIAAGLEKICHQLELESSQPLLFRNEEKHWQIELHPSAEDQNSQGDYLCSYIWGFIQEFSRWAGMGKFYAVQETSYIQNNNEHCVLLLNKQPID